MTSKVFNNEDLKDLQDKMIEDDRMEEVEENFNTYPSQVEFQELSKNQKTFVRSARKQGLPLRSYSGRYMFGRTCPAVVVECVEDCKWPPAIRKHIARDNMGLDYVVYIP